MSPNSTNSCATDFPPTERLRGLPGESLLVAGLADVQAGRVTIPACLVAMVQTRLQRAGLLPANPAPIPADPELTLYALLRRQGGDAYSRYNALVRELSSALQALDHRLRREQNANR